MVELDAGVHGGEALCFLLTGLFLGFENLPPGNALGRQMLKQ